MMSMRKQIEGKLKEAFLPSALQVADNSHHHAGHMEAGDSPSETHFSVVIVSEAFVGKSRVQSHQLVYGVLKEELAASVHALAIDAKAS